MIIVDRKLEMFVEEMFQNGNENDAYTRGYCRECNVPLILYNYFFYCEQCCEMNVSEPLYNDDYTDKKSKKTTYTRRSYFVEKLKMMSGHKQSKSPIYNCIINRLSMIEFEDIYELKKIMKDLRFHTHYKYIYDIYKDLTGIKLIDLTYSDINIIADRFIQINDNFKININDRNNMISYNLLIRNIMKELGYGCYKYIIVPKKTRYIKKIYKKINI